MLRKSISLGLSLLIASSAWAAPYQWSNVAIGGGGFVSGLVTSRAGAGLVYARTDVGGAYRWDGTTARWVPLTDWMSDRETGLLGIEALAIDPQAPNKLYMLAGTEYHNGGSTAILRSSDYGKTFTKVDVTAQFKAHGNGMGRNSGEKLQVDPANGSILYVGTRANGLFKSVDAGLSWRRVDALDVTTTPSGNGIPFVLLDPASVDKGAAQRIIVGVSRSTANLWISIDAGASFTPVTGAPSALMPQRAVLAGGDLIVTYGNGAGPWAKSAAEPLDQGQVWKYRMATGAWTNITPPLNRAYSGVTVDPANPARIAVSTINHYAHQYGKASGDAIFFSKDGGASWTDVIAQGFVLDPKSISWIDGNSIHWAASIEFDPADPRAAIVVSGNGIFRTPNIEAKPVTWAFHVAGLEETVPLGLVSIPQGPLVSVIGDYDGFVHGDLHQYPAIVTPTMGTTSGLAYAAGNSKVLARVGKAMYLSGDMGKSWTRTATMHGQHGQLALNASGEVLLHSPDNSSDSYLSSNAGASWTKVDGLSVNNAYPVADPVDPKRFYALDGDRLLVSKDAGASFRPAGKLPSAWGSKVVRAAPERTGDLWVALYGGGLARSTDGGNSFAPLRNVAEAAAIGFGKAPAGASYPTVYLWGTVDGVRGMFCSADTGASWVRVNDDQHQYGGLGNGQFVVGDMNRPGVVYMSTAGRGLVVGASATGQACR